MKKISQKEIVLNRLQKHGEISAVWAVQNYILRLSERIRELKEDGHNIETFYKYKKKRRLPYAFYRIVKE